MRSQSAHRRREKMLAVNMAMSTPARVNLPQNDALPANIIRRNIAVSASLILHTENNGHLILLRFDDDSRTDGNESAAPRNLFIISMPEIDIRHELLMRLRAGALRP